MQTSLIPCLAFLAYTADEYGKACNIHLTEKYTVRDTLKQNDHSERSRFPRNTDIVQVLSLSTPCSYIIKLALLLYTYLECSPLAPLNKPNL